MSTRCRECARLCVPYSVDGTDAVLCVHCIAAAVDTAYRHYIAQRINVPGHDWPAERCPTCWRLSALEATR